MMSVYHNNTEEAAPESNELHGSKYGWSLCRNSLMGVLSLTLGMAALLSFVVFVVCVWLFPMSLRIAFYAGLIAGACSLFGLIIGVAGSLGMKVEKGVTFFGRTTVDVSLGAAVLLLVIFIFMPWLHFARQKHASIVWGGLVHIKRLYKSTMKYSNSHDGYLPDANGWADSLVEFDGSLSRNDFIHPSLKGAGCNFALNKNIAGRRLADCPNDVVLLFEAEGPWNLAGGVELLHPRKGIDVYVCLTSGECYRVDFERPQIKEHYPASKETKIEYLRWEP